MRARAGVRRAGKGLGVGLPREGVGVEEGEGLR